MENEASAMKRGSELLVQAAVHWKSIMDHYQLKGRARALIEERGEGGDEEKNRAGNSSTTKVVDKTGGSFINRGTTSASPPLSLFQLLRWALGVFKL